MFLMNSPTKLPVGLKKIKTKVTWRVDKFVPFLCIIIIIIITIIIIIIILFITPCDGVGNGNLNIKLQCFLLAEYYQGMLYQNRSCMIDSCKVNASSLSEVQATHGKNFLKF